MRWFRITVDGSTYEVEVEEIHPQSHDRAEKPELPVRVSASPAETPEKKEQPEAKCEPVEAGGTKVIAPMPGKILSVKAGPGQTVKRGDVLMVLEAMKMENEIQAPVAGTVTAIAVAEGANVGAGALLACIG